MYYPGTPDAAQASKIVVKQGEEIPSIEMLMRQVPVHRIRGRVYNQITHKPGVGTTVILSAKITGHEWQYGNQDIDVQKQDGSFEIPEAVPGSYVLIGFWFDEGKVYSTTMPSKSPMQMSKELPSRSRRESISVDRLFGKVRRVWRGMSSR